MKAAMTKHYAYVFEFQQESTLKRIFNYFRKRKTDSQGTTI